MRHVAFLTVFLSIMLVASTQRADAQRNSDRISYSYLYDDPYAFKKFKVHLDILGLDWSMGNFPIHAGLQFNINPHPRINIEVLYRASYYDFRFHAARKNENKMSDNTLLPFMYGEALLEWNAVDKEKRRNLKFNLAQLTGYNWQYTEYAYIPIAYRRFFSLRAGANYYIMPVEGTSKVPLNVEGTTTTYQNNYYTMAKGMALFGGISWGRKARTAIKIRDYGIRRVVQQNQFMVDVMYGVPDIADLKIGSNEYALNLTKPRNIGWRIGWQWSNFNLHQRFEFGQRPSIDKSYFFMMYTLGFTIVGREKG
ncbi:hypothetical protein BH09BAC1_BH09BAC1_13380 [soil metagenome]